MNGKETKNGGQKKIPRASVNPRGIKIKTENGVKGVKVPSDVPVGKVAEFQVYCQAKYDYEHSCRKFKASNGKIYALPAMNKTMIIKLLKNEEEINAFVEADRKVRSQSAKLMGLKKKVYGDMYQGDARALFDEYAAYILETLGKGYSAEEVHKELVKKKVAIKYETIVDFHKKNREKITELRNQFNSDLQDVSLYSKRSRLEKLNYLFHEINDDFEKVTAPALRTNLSKELRGIIEQAKKEVEGENLKLTIDGNIDVNASLSAMMDSNRMLYGLTINQIVIARVAARLRLPSQWLIDRLANSYYARYNGYRSNEDLATKPIYPTSVKYDILSEEMVLKNREYEEKQKSYDIVQEPEPEEQVNLADKEEIKMRLKEMLHIK